MARRLVIKAECKPQRIVVVHSFEIIHWCNPCSCPAQSYEGIDRLLRPVAVSGQELLVVAVLGLAVNAVTAFILFRSGLEDLNTKGAWLHMLADGISSVAVVIGALVIVFTGWWVIDPLLSILVALVVGKWSWGLLREATGILLERKPDHIKLAASRALS